MTPQFLMGYAGGFFSHVVNKPDLSLRVQKKQNKKDIFTPPPPKPMCFAPYPLLQPGIGKQLLTAYHPDVDDVEMHGLALVHRVGCEMPQIESDEAQRFSTYAKAFIRTTWPGGLRREKKTFMEWLDATNYSGSRKLALRKHLSKFTGLTKRGLTVKAFGKMEFHDKIKILRFINPLDDEIKILLGPLFNAIDKETFSAKWFVKGTDPKTWPAKLAEVLAENKVVGTDFTSFEAHHRGVHAEIIHYWIMHMLRGIPGHQDFKRLISKLVLGCNRIESKHFVASIAQRLMSGAQWTSSANGMLNLLMMSYFSMRNKYPDVVDDELLAVRAFSEFRGLCEGDDGICVDIGFKPEILEPLLTKLGVKLKFDKFDHYSAAGFCKIFTDTTTGNVVKDPVSVMKKFFWLDRKYMGRKKTFLMSLLRARAMSLNVNYDSCPILAALAFVVLEKTKGYDVRAVRTEYNAYDIESLDRAIDYHKNSRHQLKEIPISSRVCVERLFGLSLLEQERIEGSILACRNLDAITVDMLGYITKEMMKYSDSHVVQHPSLFTRPNVRSTHRHETLVAGKLVVEPLSFDISFIQPIDGRNTEMVDKVEANYKRSPHHFDPRGLFEVFDGQLE